LKVAQLNLFKPGLSKGLSPGKTRPRGYSHSGGKTPVPLAGMQQKPAARKSNALPAELIRGLRFLSRNPAC
jgi:hypothetical protein